jgi:hypothetical protein
MVMILLNITDINVVINALYMLLICEVLVKIILHIKI